VTTTWKLEPCRGYKWLQSNSLRSNDRSVFSFYPPVSTVRSGVSCRSGERSARRRADPGLRSPQGETLDAVVNLTRGGAARDRLEAGNGIVLVECASAESETRTRNAVPLRPRFCWLSAMVLRVAGTRAAAARGVAPLRRAEPSRARPVRRGPLHGRSTVQPGSVSRGGRGCSR
jgi:hypothetical protein